MEFPTIFYRSPGVHNAGGMLTYDYVAAPDEDRVDELAADGWHPSLEAALAANEPKLGQTAPDPATMSSRALLEAEAKRLGVGFNWKTSDEALEQRITEKRAE